MHEHLSIPARIERQWIPGSGGQYLGPCKSSDTFRTLVLGAEGMTLLDRYRRRMADLLNREPEGWIRLAASRIEEVDVQRWREVQRTGREPRLRPTRFGPRRPAVGIVGALAHFVRYRRNDSRRIYAVPHEIS